MFRIKNENNEVKDKISYALGKDEVMGILDAVGLEKGMLLFVDANCLNMPKTIGGAQTWVNCLMEKIGYEGTIVMPAYSLQLTDPSTTMIYDRSLYRKVRENIQAFDERLTAVSETTQLTTSFLKEEGVFRSSHPLFSFAAWGKYAKVICSKHPLHFALSKSSPLGKFYEMGGFVLLLGKEYTGSSIFHLSRYMDKKNGVRILKAPIQTRSGICWKALLEVEMKEDGYQIVGEFLEKKKMVNIHYMDKGEVRLFAMRNGIQSLLEYNDLQE